MVRVALTGLQPGTEYYYRPLVDGRPGKYMETSPAFRFRTAPGEGRAARFRVAFGSCCRWQEFPVQPIWRALEQWEPDLFLWLGDNIYADTLEPEIMSDLYKIQRSVPEYRDFGSRVPQLATWDDHDWGLNNHDRELPIAEQSLALFQRFWANPGYGTSQVPGVFFQHHWGGVDFFMLDNRYHRSPNEDPDGPEKTMLGEANCIPWSGEGGYDLIELVSSGLAQDPGIPESIETPEIRLREPYVGGHNAGVIDFDLTGDDPVLRFKVINITGQAVWDQPVEIRASDLVNGVRSWHEKVDPELSEPVRKRG